MLRVGSVEAGEVDGAGIAVCAAWGASGRVSEPRVVASCPGFPSALRLESLTFGGVLSEAFRAKSVVDWAYPCIEEEKSTMATRRAIPRRMSAERRSWEGCGHINLRLYNRA